MTNKKLSGGASQYRNSVRQSVQCSRAALMPVILNPWRYSKSFFSLDLPKKLVDTIFLEFFFVVLLDIPLSFWHLICFFFQIWLYIIKLTKQAILKKTHANCTFSKANEKYNIKDKDFLWKIQTMFEKKEKRKMNNQDQ